MEQIMSASATVLARAMRAKEVSALEVVSAHLVRIEQVNPRLNAVVHLAADLALAQARRADAALAQGQILGPLHGLPITIKDSLDTADMITTGGTQGRANFVPAQDATVVARLRAAGAIILGKTNTPELTMDGETDNFIYGRTNNPYDTALSPGGSSGGAAAIIAAGGSPLDIGSDTGGSIRVPAHFCGIAGIRPTSGRVPRTGHITSFDMAALDSLTQLGPMARYVEDLSLTLPIIAGVDWRDPSVIPMPLGQPDQIELKGLWAALYSDNGVASPTPDTVEVVQQAAKTLANCGMHVVEDRPPDLDLPAQLWFELFRADGGAKILALLAQAGTTQMHPSLQWILDGRLLSAAEFADLLARWVQFCSHMLAFLEKYDAILCPAAPEPAPPHGKVVAHHYSYVEPYNLTGWPAVVVRAGTSAQGLPIGVQIVARPWREDVALAVAQRLEAALGGWRPPVL